MRHRNMYYATGLPGWMRFGYSPGWVGRSPSGLGPCAQFLMGGERPAPQMQSVGFDRVTALKNQASMLQQQLDAVNAQIAELEND